MPVDLVRISFHNKGLSIKSAGLCYFDLHFPFVFVSSYTIAFSRTAFHLLALILFGLPRILIASPDLSLLDYQDLIQQAHAKQLANHPYWLALGHYQSDSSNFKSEILTDGFFTSPSGKIDPSLELDATLKSFFDPITSNPDQHTQCRFIGRYHWLKKQLDWGSMHPPAVRCEQYTMWSQRDQIKSASLIFATGNLSNPASFFGHILLKFNPMDRNKHSTLLDQSLNYGAVVPDNENPIVYVLKGLFGGYNAGYSQSTFYRQNHAYAENELRDLWEYELNLAPEEIERLLSHSWELLNAQFQYFFATDNCAYRMAKLLEMATDLPLTSSLKPWTTPIDVFHIISAINRENYPLVTKIERIPSRESRFYDAYTRMDTALQETAITLVDTKLDFKTASYNNLRGNQRVEVINALLYYYDFRIITDSEASSLTEQKNKLLIERLSLPSQADDSQEVTQAANFDPTKGSEPALIRLSAFYNDNLDNGIELRMRPANYDILGLDIGHPNYSGISMLDITLIRTKHQLSLKRLDVVNIETYNPSKTGLPGDGGMAWKFKFGIENQDLNCIECNIVNAQGGIGRGALVGRNSLVYAMLESGLQTEYDSSGTIFGLLRAGFIVQAAPAWKTHLTVAQKKYLNGSNATTRLVTWDHRIGSHRNWDLRLIYNQHVAKELKAGISYYW